jgi:hypothetical protein
MRPSLPACALPQRISFVAHSMGGLLARYAIGALFNPEQGTVAGLQPVHYISMATPHMGCDAGGVSQVGPYRVHGQLALRHNIMCCAAQPTAACPHCLTPLPLPLTPPP